MFAILGARGYRTYPLGRQQRGTSVGVETRGRQDPPFEWQDPMDPKPCAAV